jgi:protein TonB
MTVASTRAPQSATAATQSAATPAAVAAAQQQPAADATPVYAPDTVVDARFIHEVQPDYPAIAKEQGAEGTAVVFATVGPKGNVMSTRIDQSTGNRLLDQAALSAARESSFEAPEINGREATETYRIVYTFAL